MLTDAKIKAAKAGEKARKLYDSGGLFVLLSAGKGGETHKRWRFKFTVDGKEKVLALGTYPDVSLAEARERRDGARALLRRGVDPAAERKAEKRQTRARQEHSFSAVAGEWFEAKRDAWSERYAGAVRTLLDDELAPMIGDKPVAELAPMDLLEVIRKIEKRGATTIAEKTLNAAGQVLRYAVATGRLASDPSRDLRGALKSRPVKHHARLTEAEMPVFLQAVEGYTGAPVTKLALKLLLLTALRTYELRFATWAEFDLEARLWRIPKERMKMRREHLVPLSDQALAIIEELRPLSGKRPFVFPNDHHPGTKAMSENAILFALYRLGYRSRLTGHGFRSMFSTIAHESGLFDSRVIELQLAHSDQNSIRAIYNSAQLLRDRKRLMQWWADRLDELRKGKEPRVISLEAARSA